MSPFGLHSFLGGEILDVQAQAAAVVSAWASEQLRSLMYSAGSARSDKHVLALTPALRRVRVFVLGQTRGEGRTLLQYIAVTFIFSTLFVY